jgi:hypothetical protein
MTVNYSPAELRDSEAPGDCRKYLRNIIVKVQRDSSRKGESDARTGEQNSESRSETHSCVHISLTLTSV